MAAIQGTAHLSPHVRGEVLALESNSKAVALNRERDPHGNSTTPNPWSTVQLQGGRLVCAFECLPRAGVLCFVHLVFISPSDDQFGRPRLRPCVSLSGCIWKASRGLYRSVHIALFLRLDLYLLGE